MVRFVDHRPLIGSSMRLFLETLYPMAMANLMSPMRSPKKSRSGSGIGELSWIIVADSACLATLFGSKPGCRTQQFSNRKTSLQRSHGGSKARALGMVLLRGFSRYMA